MTLKMKRALNMKILTAIGEGEEEELRGRRGRIHASE